MSTEEKEQCIAGHPPAMKVGGVRMANRVRRDSEENASKTKEKKEKPEEQQVAGFNPYKPPVMVTGVSNKYEKEPVEAIKHFHEKPVPTHQKSVPVTKPSVIQQPRK